MVGLAVTSAVADVSEMGRPTSVFSILEVSTWPGVDVVLLSDVGAQEMMVRRMNKETINFDQALLVQMSIMSNLFNGCSCNNSCYTIYFGYTSIEYKPHGGGHQCALGS